MEVFNLDMGVHKTVEARVFSAINYLKKLMLQKPKD